MSKFVILFYLMKHNKDIFSNIALFILAVHRIVSSLLIYLLVFNFHDFVNLLNKILCILDIIYVFLS